MSIPASLGNLADCDGGKHALVSICRHDEGYGVSAVVRWCKVCGCIVVDSECDGRVYPGKLMPMRAPRLFTEIKREGE